MSLLFFVLAIVSVLALVYAAVEGAVGKDRERRLRESERKEAESERRRESERLAAEESARRKEAVDGTRKEITTGNASSDFAASVDVLHNLVQNSPKRN